MHTKAKHTPGPWYVRASRDRGGDPSISTGQPGTAYARAEEVAGFVHGDANANLIAAAPDLLAALEHTKAAIEEAVTLSAMHNGHEYSFKSTIEKISAALAKAKGEA